MLLVVSSLNEIFFRLTGSFLEHFFFQASSSKVECLALMDGCLTICRVAVIHVVVLMPVHELNIQASHDLTVLKKDPSVQKYHFLG